VQWVQWSADRINIPILHVHHHNHGTHHAQPTSASQQHAHMPSPKQMTHRRRLSAPSIDDRTQYNHSPPQVPPNQPTAHVHHHNLDTHLAQPTSAPSQHAHRPPPRQMTHRSRLSAPNIDDRTQYDHSPPQVPTQSHRTPSQPTHTSSAASSTIDALASVRPAAPSPVDLRPPPPARAFTATAPPSLISSHGANQCNCALKQPHLTPA